MNLTPLSETMPNLPPTSSKSSTTDRPATSRFHPLIHWCGTFPTPPLHLSKKSHPRPCSKYASALTAWGTTRLYPLGQLRPSFAWRTTTSPTLHMLLHTALSQWCGTVLPSPTNTLPRQDTASTNSPEQYPPTRPRSVTSKAATRPPKCHPTSSATADEWTFKCPHTVARTSLPSGSELWGTVRSSPELESTLTSQNTWSPFTSHQTTHSDPPPLYRTGSSNFCKPEGGPTTPWLKRPVASTTPLLSLK